MGKNVTTFIVPILPYLLEVRNHVDPHDTQRLSYQILTLHGAVSCVSGFTIGQIADRFQSRKTPLIIGLGLAFVGTALLASATHLSGVFIGRFLQAIGGSTAWLIGFATLRDTIEAKDVGKTFGLVNSFSCAGALTGPAMAGFLLEVAGYWAAWGTVLGVLMLDIIMRMVMLESPKRKKKLTSAVVGNGLQAPQAETANTDEHSAMLGGARPQSYDSNTYQSGGSKRINDTMSTMSLYRTILSQPRVIVGLLCYTAHSSLMASYSTTIPTHVKETFGWGSLPTGILFSLLQTPCIVLSPVSGWLRDKVGTRSPTTVGFLLLAPLIWLLGAADQPQFPWASTKEHAKTTYTLMVAAIGCVQNLLSTVGAIEITCKRIFPLLRSGDKTRLTDL
ncbi:MFS amine [Seiridium cupressi]